MGERINLPDGGWVQLRDKLTLGGRQIIQAAMPPALSGLRKLPSGAQAGTALEKFPTLTLEDGQAFANFNNATILAYLESWSLPDPLPRSLSDVENIDPDVGDAISKAAAPRAAKEVFGIVVDVDDAGDPESPTVPSEP